MFKKGSWLYKFHENQVSFNIFKALSFPDEGDTCFRIDLVSSYTKEVINEIYFDKLLAISLMDTSHTINLKILEQVNYLKANSPIFIKRPFEDLGERPLKPIPSLEKWS